MVYLVGGYKLTRDQVLEWARPRNLDLPEGNTTLVINRYLRSLGITQTRLLACDYDGEGIYLVVTDKKVDRNGTPHKFEPFQESQRARQVKALVEMDGEVEFVTVSNPYGY